MDESTITRRISELLLVLNNHHSVSDLASDALTVVPELFSLLTDEDVVNQQEKVDAIMELSDLLPNICPPKELIIALLDQADSFKDYVKFKALLSPIQKSIQLLPLKSRFFSLDLAADNLYEHLGSEPVPEDETELVETLALGTGKSADNLSQTVMDFLKFLEPFVNDLSWFNKQSTGMSTNSKKHVRNLTVSLIKVLNRPLGYLNLSAAEPKTLCYLCAECCMISISHLQNNFIKMIEESLEHNETVARIVKQRKLLEEKQILSGHSEDLDDFEGNKSSLEELVPEIGLGVIAYLIFSQNFQFSSFPQVYTSYYIFSICRRFIVLLLKSSHSQLVHKGLKLCSSSLEKFPAKSFDCQELDCDEMKELIKSLMHIVISTKVKELNVLAVTTFQTFLKLYDVNGRIIFLKFVSETFHQSNVQAYIVTLVKNEMADCMEQHGENSDEAAIFLKKFFSQFFDTKLLIEKNLLDDGDRILATLNLLRFLVIRDRHNCNITRIWNYIPAIQENYMKTLRANLKVMRSVSQEKIQRLKTRDLAASGQSSEFAMDVKIKDQILDDLTPEQQKDALQSACNNIDLIESVLIRVEQLIDEEKTLGLPQ